MVVSVGTRDVMAFRKVRVIQVRCQLVTLTIPTPSFDLTNLIFVEVGHHLHSNPYRSLCHLKECIYY